MRKSAPSGAWRDWTKKTKSVLLINILAESGHGVDGGDGMYQAGDMIIYGNTGVCRVAAVGLLDMRGVDPGKLFYTLVPLYESGTIYAPVDVPTVIRPVLNKEEALALIDEAPAIEPKPGGAPQQSIREVEMTYRDMLASCDCADLFQLIRTIYAKGVAALKHNRTLGQIDQRYMKRAQAMLEGELAVALDMPLEEVGAFIEARITRKSASAYHKSDPSLF